MPYEIRFASKLNVTQPLLWNSISKMKGVNEELFPLLRMTYPKEASVANLENANTGQTLFVSTILLFCFLPIDFHSLRLEKVDPGLGFKENSTSLTQHFWKHERKLRSAGDNNCIITDRVRFEPRVRLIGSLVRFFVNRLFAHRHRRLHKRYGGEFMSYPD